MLQLNEAQRKNLVATVYVNVFLLAIHLILLCFLENLKQAPAFNASNTKLTCVLFYLFLYSLTTNEAPKTLFSTGYQSNHSLGYRHQRRIQTHAQTHHSSYCKKAFPAVLPSVPISLSSYCRVDSTRIIEQNISMSFPTI